MPNLNHRNKDPARGEAAASFPKVPNLVIFSACFCILCAALILNPPNSKLPYLCLGDIPVPGLCVFNNLIGLPCPGCGLVRSMVAAVRGDVGGSFAFHRLGLLTLAYIIFQFGFRLGALLFPVWWARNLGEGRLLNKGIIVLGILFSLNWIVTLALL